jgi:hypothetical protein
VDSYRRRAAALAAAATVSVHQAGSQDADWRSLRGSPPPRGRVGPLGPVDHFIPRPRRDRPRHVGGRRSARRDSPPPAGNRTGPARKGGGRQLRGAVRGGLAAYRPAPRLVRPAAPRRRWPACSRRPDRRRDSAPRAGCCWPQAPSLGSPPRSWGRWCGSGGASCWPARRCYAAFSPRRSPSSPGPSWSPCWRPRSLRRPGPHGERGARSARRPLLPAAGLPPCCRCISSLARCSPRSTCRRWTSPRRTGTSRWPASSSAGTR